MSDAVVVSLSPALHEPAERLLVALGFGTTVVAPEQLRELVEQDAACPDALVLIDNVERAASVVSSSDRWSAVPVIVVATPERLVTGGYGSICGELLVAPYGEAELAVRVARAQGRGAPSAESDVVRVGSLELNTATYQVTVEGQPVDFTYIEYELLKFLVLNPNRVFSREALLENVWGYDYFGGARTVDVHVRRLRAKLGHEHAARIRTLRSVGYRWDGTAR